MAVKYSEHQYGYNWCQYGYGILGVSMAIRYSISMGITGVSMGITGVSMGMEYWVSVWL